MKQQLEQLVLDTVNQLPEDVLPADARPDSVTLERTRDAAHGDFATNIAMRLAKPCRMAPRAIAEKIVADLPLGNGLEKAEIAGPGFINLFIARNAQFAVVNTVLSEGDSYGLSKPDSLEKVMVEFVSANPTGPLHVGHGRGAAYGATVSNLLAAAGYQVHREYYVNDAGRQMDILAVSVWLRYLQCKSVAVPFPLNGYQGDYVKDIATGLLTQHGDKFMHSDDAVQADMPVDNEENKELYVDALIARARELLGEENYQTVFDAGLNNILEGIKTDLIDFGVEFDEWFSERSLQPQVNEAVTELEQAGHIETRDGGTKWFKSTEFGDDKDRVVVRDNGLTTYFASDIAYHRNKKQRGFDTLIDVWGSDHHGYITRVKAGMQACGLQPDDMEVKLVQFAILYRGDERVPMSTRSGQFVTLADLVQEVGRDAARYFYVSRSNDQHLDFDLELAKSQSNDNPVYYIQYAHARVCSVLNEASERGMPHDQAAGIAAVDRLGEPQEEALATALARYPEMVQLAARNRAPQTIAHFLRELAQAFHSCYNSHKLLIDDAELRNARIALAAATAQVLRNGLGLLGVSAPERM